MIKPVIRLQIIGVVLLVFIMQSFALIACACEHNPYVLQGLNKVKVGVEIACWDSNVTRFLSRAEIKTLVQKMLEDNSIATMPIESPTPVVPVLHIEINCLPSASRSIATLSLVISLHEEAKLSYRNSTEPLTVCTWSTERNMTMPKPSKEKYDSIVRDLVQAFIDQYKQANK